MKVIGIYKITNLTNGKIYIGQTANYEKRKRTHITHLNSGKHHNLYLQNAWNKYGEHSFEINLIEECSVDELDEREIFYIETFNTTNIEHGYNLMTGGQKYRKFTDAVKKKMSVAGKGRKKSDEHRFKISQSHFNKKMSEESILKTKLTKKLKGCHIGEKNANALLSDEQAELIIKDLLNNKSVSSICKQYNVGQNAIYNILYNRSYPHIMPEVRESLKTLKSEIFQNRIEYAIELYLEGESQNAISKTVGMSRNTLRRELEARNIEIRCH